MPINETTPESSRPPTAPPSWFDCLTGNEEKPDLAAAAALDDFAAAIRLAPHWRLETGSGGTIALRICSHRRGSRVEMMADLAGERMQIALEPDASGWLSIAARCGGQEVFRAWLDRPYEVYEFWPEGAAILPLRTTEAPGRIGKRRNWVNLSAAAWPPLARFANSFGVVAASEMEEPLQERSGES